MKWCHLISDSWVGLLANEVTQFNPTKAQIEESIQLLNGESRTSMTFAADDGREMVVSGGPKKFVVSLAYNDDDLFTLKDFTKEDTDVELTTGGQIGIFGEQEVCDLQRAIQAADYFYDYFVHDPSLIWGKVG